MAFSKVKVGPEPSNRLEEIAQKVKGILDKAIASLGYGEDELEFVLIVSKRTGETTCESGMVANVELEQLVGILTRNVEALLTPESMAQWRELILARGEAPS